MTIVSLLSCVPALGESAFLTFSAPRFCSRNIIGNNDLNIFLFVTSLLFLCFQLGSVRSDLFCFHQKFSTNLMISFAEAEKDCQCQSCFRMQVMIGGAIVKSFCYLLWLTMYWSIKMLNIRKMNICIQRKKHLIITSEQPQ